jgi:hypothetical protein
VQDFCAVIILSRNLSFAFFVVGGLSYSSYRLYIQDLRGIHSAREFVWWYNGHPDMCNLAPDLKNTETAVVLGQVYDFSPIKRTST